MTNSILTEEQKAARTKWAERKYWLRIAAR